MTKAQQSKSQRAEREARRRARARELRERQLRERPRHQVSVSEAQLIRKARMDRMSIDRAEARLDAAVIRMHDLGLTYGQIAAAFDITRQGAMKRHQRALGKLKAEGATAVVVIPSDSAGI